MTVPGQAVSIDQIGEELEAAARNAAGVKPDELKLDGDAVPEAFRGKTLAEVLRQNEVLAQSVQIANAARQAAEAAAKNGQPVVLPSTPAPEPIKKLTKEELAGMFETDPIAAVAYMQDIAIQDASMQFERRFGSLSAGASVTAETRMREKYAAEFELFGDQIKQIAASVPDKSALANPEGWEHIVSFVRGKPGNFEKLLEHRTARQAEAAAIAAREAQSFSAGASFSAASARPAAAPSAAPSGGGNYGLDAEELKAAANMGIDPKEYAKWKNIGG